MAETVRDVMTANPKTVEASATLDEAAKKDGTPVGIVSLGDLARDRDRDSALADISSAAPNN
jgi:CBS domain-containing protein